MFFRFIGWRGILAFMLGMFIMAYLILSKNAMLNFIVEYIEDYNRKKYDKK
jgi:hypothetical protein